MKKSQKPPWTAATSSRAPPEPPRSPESATPAAQAQRAEGNGVTPRLSREPFRRRRPSSWRATRVNVRPPATARAVTRPGSDLMVQAFHDLGLVYVAAQAGSTLKASGIRYQLWPDPEQDAGSLSQHCMRNPQWRWCTATPRPRQADALLCCTAPSACSTPRSAIYNAYYDRAPIVMIAGNDRGDIPSHTALDMAGMVRSFTKWTPQAQRRSTKRSRRFIAPITRAITPPQAPTLVVMDSGCRE